MQRTRPSPICWATSAAMTSVLALELDVHLDGEVDLGQGVGGELDVDDGPGDGDDAAGGQRLGLGGLGAVVVMSVGLP